MRFGSDVEFGFVLFFFYAKLGQRVSAQIDFLTLISGLSSLSSFSPPPLVFLSHTPPPEAEDQ